MISLLRFYLHHGMLINVVIAFCLVCFGVLNIAVGRITPLIGSTIRGLWVLSALTLILVMTLSPFQEGAVTGFESLNVSQVVTHITQPASSGAQWPDWHDPAGNILMTVPLATALAMTWSPTRTVAATFLLSVAIEITQHFYGHGRTPQLSDVVLNTLGGIVGVAIARMSQGIADRLWKRPRLVQQ